MNETYLISVFIYKKFAVDRAAKRASYAKKFFDKRSVVPFVSAYMPFVL